MDVVSRIDRYLNERTYKFDPKQKTQMVIAMRKKGWNDEGIRRALSLNKEKWNLIMKELGEKQI